MRDRWDVSIHWALYYALTQIPLPGVGDSIEDRVEHILYEWIKNYREEMKDGVLNLDNCIDHYEHLGAGSLKLWKESKEAEDGKTD